MEHVTNLPRLGNLPLSDVRTQGGASLILLCVLGMCACLIGWMVAGPLIGAGLMLAETLLLFIGIWIYTRLS